MALNFNGIHLDFLQFLVTVFLSGLRLSTSARLLCCFHLAAIHLGSRTSLCRFPPISLPSRFKNLSLPSFLFFWQTKTDQISFSSQRTSPLNRYSKIVHRMSTHMCLDVTWLLTLLLTGRVNAQLSNWYAKKNFFKRKNIFFVEFFLKWKIVLRSFRPFRNLKLCKMVMFPLSYTLRHSNAARRGNSEQRNNQTNKQTNKLFPKLCSSSI